MMKNKIVTLGAVVCFLLLTGQTGLFKPGIKSDAKRRLEILKKMEQVMGRLPEYDQSKPPAATKVDSASFDTYTRYTLLLDVAPAEQLPVYLYIPKGLSRNQKLPAILALHGTNALGKGVVDGQGDKPNRGYGKELAERGYVVIAPDYPSFGGLEKHDFETDRYESATMQGIFNHMKCVDLLRSLPQVDPEKIGVIGLSLGGHNSMFVAAFDERIKAVISASGWTQFENYDLGEEGSKRYGGRLGPWAQTRYMPLWRTRFGLDGARIPFNFDEVISAIAPRPFFSVSPLNDANFDVRGVRKGIELAGRTYREYGVPENLQVRYPDAGHDFPVQEREESYVFFDKIFKFQPRNSLLK